ncbi:DUF1715-domain-containing protein [Hypoxylon sp. FL1284]|nr:DUF1715-domain-containing protein [Hypoxylon sp. FL1284]
MPPENDPDDLFNLDEVLNLEETYYKEGYDEGYKDGAEAGLIEGRSAGLKKGFEKYLEAGRLQGRAIIWANRIPSLKKELEDEAANSSSSQQETPKDEDQDKEREEAASSSRDEKQQDEKQQHEEQQDEKKPEDESERIQLPPLNSNPRLEKHIRMLYGMLEPGTLPTKNDDESVNDFDSRMKGALARFKMIERALREATEKGSAEKRRRPAQTSKPVQGNDNIEDIGKIPQRGESSGSKG